MCFLWVGFACPHRPFGRSLGRYVIVGTNVGMLALAAVRIEREAAMECLCSFVWEDVARTQSPSRSLQLAKSVLVPLCCFWRQLSLTLRSPRFEFREHRAFR